MCDGIRLNRCVTNLGPIGGGQNLGDYAVQMWRTKKTVQGRVFNKRHRNEATMNAGLKYKCAWCGMPYEWFPIVSVLPRDSIMNTLGVLDKNTIGYKVFDESFGERTSERQAVLPVQSVVYIV